MYPVPIGSAVKYVRATPATKTKKAGMETLDATIARYQPLAPGAKETDVPTADLMFLHPERMHQLKDANWVDAYEIIHDVPYKPTGEFYHGWSEVEDEASHDECHAQLAASEAASLAKDGLIADLEAKVKASHADATKLTDFLMTNFKSETGNETPVDCVIRLLTKQKKSGK